MGEDAFDSSDLIDHEAVVERWNKAGSGYNDACFP